MLELTTRDTSAPDRLDESLVFNEEFNGVNEYHEEQEGPEQRRLHTGGWSGLPCRLHLHRALAYKGSRSRSDGPEPIIVLLWSL